MTSKELYSKGARVWVPHPESVWEGGEVNEDYSATNLKVKTDSGQVLTILIQTDEDLPPLRNPDILIGENDLTSLSYLHEPAVLYNLQFRFCTQNSIYTYCGIVLVAINPYTELPIYNSETILEYRGKSMGELDPHIFAVAEEAYTKMEREQRDQSIIVSGESGAGKTVSAKYAMRYFATVGGSATETRIEKKVLASSPIMEAIGNAKTTRNDNSSRFGKFIELHFNKNYNIVGASMRTYLLEKSRVVFQAPEERNYHVLYQLCAARSDYPSLQLESAKSYKYLCQEEIIIGVDDSKCFQETLMALQTLGFSENKISNLFKIFASILHLGNISILENAAHGDADESFIKENDPHLLTFTELLQLDAGELRTWLCHRRIISMRESFDKPMTLSEATGARDALAKHIYAELFSWIVEIINHSLESSSDARHKFIGVLDIYGFETFETNSFEQFCINYANEKLQQQFNQHVFKLEQEEYLKEEIEWKFIDFYDNQPCIDLIEIKLGILDLLDEECRMPKGSDSTWAEKLYAKCTQWQHFEKPRFGTQAFVIKHFADRVEYEVVGFLDKNRDTVIDEQIAVLKKGGNKLVSQLFSDSSKNQHLSATMAAPTRKIKMPVTSPRTTATMGPASKHKKTVGSQFRNSLNALMTTLNATTPHYIRCIKPNDVKLAFEYDAHRAVQQLRACGVLETIRISAAGFPSRWLYMDFFNRYRVLCRSKDINRENPKLTCEHILSNVIKDLDKFKFGKNKIFFRAGQVAYLERLRSDRMRECCVMIQKSIRGFLQRKRYLKVQQATLVLQKFTRGYLARRRVHSIRQNKAAITLQKYIRGWINRVLYQRLKNLIIGLQTIGRGFLARQKYQQLKHQHAATIIQKYVRGFLCKQHYERDKHHIIIAQNAVRRFLARRLFKRLKREAKSVEHVKSLNKGLENKIISLQQRIGVLTKENNMLKGCSNELNETRSKLEHLRSADSELKKVKLLLQEREDFITKLINDLDKEKGEKIDIMVEKEKLESDYQEEKNVWHLETKKLKDQVNELNDKIISKNTSAEDILRSQFEREKLDIIREQDQDRDAYQKLLSEKNTLENHCDGLQRELAKLTGNKVYYSNHTRSLSDASTVSVMEDLPNHPSEFHDEDYGYGSVRSNGSRNTDRSYPSDWSQEITPESTLIRPTKVSVISPPTETQAIDVGLVLKLQQKLKKLENERDVLHRQIEERNDSPSEQKPHDAFKVQEFEMENSKLKSDLESLRRAFAESTSLGKPKADELISQFQKQEEELVRRREECVQLRGVLANRTTGLKNVASTNYSSEDFDIALINEDGELVLALEAQKKTNRQLVDELQLCRIKWNIEREELVAELERLRSETDNQQKLLSINFSKSPQTQTEAYMQHEITRLTSENLDLQEKRDEAVEDFRNLKKQMKDLKRKMKEAGVENLLETPVITSSTEPQINSNQPAVRMKERNYIGMFEFKAGDENVIIKHLVWDLKPQTAVKLLPGLPAYILFMCIRHTDYTNDEKKVRALLTGFINIVKKVIRKRLDDVDTTVLWLSNTLRFLHNLKQYSGEKTFKEENTVTQNEQCLRNFDLSEYRQVLSDIAVWIYQGVIHHMQEKVQQKAVAAILEHDAIPGLSSSCKRGRGLSIGDVPLANQQPLDSLLQELTSFHRTLGLHGVDPELIVQVFRQLFYYICASSLNNLLLRKDLCHWSKGMQIRYNLSHVEQWARDQKLQDPKIIEMLAPIIQAAQLLQARKTDEDVASVCEMCHNMTAHQIIKLLNLCTPANDFEERVSMSFIRKIQQKLTERTDSQDQTLLMDTKFNFSVRFPFNPSNISLEDIEIPESLHLPMLKKI